VALFIVLINSWSVTTTIIKQKEITTGINLGKEEEEESGEVLYNSFLFCDENLLQAFLHRLYALQILNALM